MWNSNEKEMATNENNKWRNIRNDNDNGRKLGIKSRNEIIIMASVRNGDSNGEKKKIK